MHIKQLVKFYSVFVSFCDDISEKYLILMSVIMFLLYLFNLVSFLFTDCKILFEKQCPVWEKIQQRI